MKERPILFSAPMVRALLAGTKTQTRRAVKPAGRDGGFILCERGDGSFWPHRSDDGESCFVTRREGGKEYLDDEPMRCPYGQPGDLLWVREAWSTHSFLDHVAPSAITTRSLHYWADGEIQTGKKRPGIHMPRWASRLTLEITDVRVERLQAISEADAKAEGCPCYVCGAPMDGKSEADCHCFHATAKPSDYRALWEQINGAGSWDANPWVWCVSFKRAAD